MSIPGNKTSYGMRPQKLSLLMTYMVQTIKPLAFVLYQFTKHV